MTLLHHQRHFGTRAAQESLCLPESVGGVELDDHYLGGGEVKRSQSIRQAQFGHISADPAAPVVPPVRL